MARAQGIARSGFEITDASQRDRDPVDIGEELPDRSLAQPANATEISRGRLKPRAKSGRGLGNDIGGGESPAVRTRERVASMMDDVPRLHRQLDDLIDDGFGIVAGQGRVTVITMTRLVIDDLVGGQDHSLVLGVTFLAASSSLA